MTYIYIASDKIRFTRIIDGVKYKIITKRSMFALTRFSEIHDLPFIALSEVQNENR